MLGTTVRMPSNLIEPDVWLMHSNLLRDERLCLYHVKLLRLPLKTEGGPFL